LNPAKQHKKLVKLATKAENCTSRKQAKEIIKKAEKAQLKLSANYLDSEKT
tara:strand:- start:48 stop:200 length:153 start_codon:yes stop_codon:yes gene_type:complete